MTDTDPEDVDAPILDQARIDELRNLLGDGPEGVDGLVETFVDRIPEVLEDLQEAAEAGDHEQMANLAHKVKGESSTLGAQRLSLQAKAIETGARDGNLSDPRALVQTLAETYAETEQAFEKES